MQCNVVVFRNLFFGGRDPVDQEVGEVEIDANNSNPLSPNILFKMRLLACRDRRSSAHNAMVAGHVTLTAPKNPTVRATEPTRL